MRPFIMPIKPPSAPAVLVPAAFANPPTPLATPSSVLDIPANTLLCSFNSSLDGIDALNLLNIP